MTKEIFKTNKNPPSHLFLGLLAALVLSACGGGDPNSEPAPTPDTTPDTTPALAATPLSPVITSMTPLSDASQSIQITWKHAGETLHSYEIYYRRTGTSGWLWSQTATVGEAHSSWVPYVAGQATYTRDFRIKDAAPGISYDISVRALTDKKVGSPRELSMRTVLLPPPSNELFISSPTSAFVSTATGQPVVLNGVNLKRSVHRNTTKTWQTTYVQEEIFALGQPGAPAFTTIRIAMDWPYFQKKNDEGAVVTDPEAFKQLDLLIDEAIKQKLYVILDPIHLISVGTTQCTEDGVMKGAHRNIPAWAWEKVTKKDPGASCENDDYWNVRTDDVLALPETATYLKYILERYDPAAKATEASSQAEAQARGRQVIAIDLVNEPHASSKDTTVDAATGMQTLVKTVYGPWLSDTHPNSLRTANPDKILIISPIAGSGSLATGINAATGKSMVDLTAVARPNVVMSFHDYFGAAVPPDTIHSFGFGYDKYGFATGISTDVRRKDGKSPYDPSLKSYDDRMKEHTRYITQFKGWAAQYGMPIYVGEYGILNSCKGGGWDPVKQYAKDTNSLYTSLGLSRTVWTNGYWDDMAIWLRGGVACGAESPKKFLPHANLYTGGVARK